MFAGLSCYTMLVRTRNCGPQYNGSTCEEEEKCAKQGKRDVGLSPADIGCPLDKAPSCGLQVGFPDPLYTCYETDSSHPRRIPVGIMSTHRNLSTLPKPKGWCVDYPTTL